jgi:hypothetical protein
MKAAKLLAKAAKLGSKAAFKKAAAGELAGEVPCITELCTGQQQTHLASRHV